MVATVLCRMVDSRTTLTFESLHGFVQRMRGLLGPRARGRPVALVGCSSIHTLGMRYGIDVALVSRNGKVLLSRRDVGPGRIVSARGAWLALERPAEQTSWPCEGSWVSLVERGAQTARGGISHVRDRS